MYGAVLTGYVPCAKRNSSCRINAAFRSEPERCIYAAEWCSRRNLSCALIQKHPGTRVPGCYSQSRSAAQESWRFQSEKAGGLGWVDRNGIRECAAAIKQARAVRGPGGRGRRNIRRSQPRIAAIGRTPRADKNEYT